MKRKNPNSQAFSLRCRYHRHEDKRFLACADGQLLGTAITSSSLTVMAWYQYTWWREWGPGVNISRVKELDVLKSADQMLSRCTSTISARGTPAGRPGMVALWAASFDPLRVQGGQRG